MLDSTLLVGLIGAVATIAAALIVRMPAREQPQAKVPDRSEGEGYRRPASLRGSALIVAGGIVLASTAAASVVESSLYQSRLIDYFDRHGSGSPVDKLEATRPTRYLWFSGVVGTGIVVLGLRRSRLTASE